MLQHVRGMRLPPGAALAALLTFAGAWTPAALHAQEARDASAVRSQILVSGMGEARVAPDRATIQIGVQSRAATAAAAASENARKQRAVIEAIRALGVAQEQIGTSQFSVYPDMQHDPRTQTARVAGYVVSNVVRVEVRRLDQVGPIIDAALSRGANQINALDFWAQNTEEARQTALTQAVARARSEAEVIARAAGGSLGALLEISTTGYMPSPRREVMMARADMGGVAAPTPIEPGEEVIRAMITARWQFVPATR